MKNKGLPRLVALSVFLLKGRKSLLLRISGRGLLGDANRGRIAGGLSFFFRIEPTLIFRLDSLCPGTPGPIIFCAAFTGHKHSFGVLSYVLHPLPRCRI